MDFSVDFFKDEVRNGFYIPSAIKQAWAANLCVLNQIDRICAKYGIQYFADWGSILGAVRHGGYVPWDDDLDICMKRADYNRFREVADKELPEEFAIHDFIRKEDHWLFLARVVNCNHISFDDEHLRKYHNFPYIAVVDIFVKDYLYRDENKERERIDQIKRLVAVADGIVEGSFNTYTENRVLTDIEKKYRVKIDRNADRRDKGIRLYSLAEKLMASVPESEADNIGQMFPMVLRGNKGLPKEYYDKSVRIPFENTTIPVPARYNQILRERYGNYLEIHKIWSGHNYPYFEGQRENLQAVADFSLPEFTFKKEMLEPCDRLSNQEESIVGISKGFIKELEYMNARLIDCFADDDFDNVSQLLPELQQFAVDYGTMIEGVYGENSSKVIDVVSVLQNYCDRLYDIYMFIDGNNEEDKSYRMDNLKKACEESVTIIAANIIDKRQILFLTTGYREWNTFDNIYREAKAKGEFDIYVVPIPVFFKDIYGKVITSGAGNASMEYEGYPDDITFTSWVDYKVEFHRPDVIYIQNPYDGENPCLTIPPVFYAENLRRYTNKLIYIPPFITGEFGKEDYNDVYNMKHYVTAPGVIYADKVLVQSNNMRTMYINKLTEFAGEGTRDIWLDKITVVGQTHKSMGLDESSCNNAQNRKKKIFYCIGLNEISEHERDILDDVKDKMNMFCSSRNEGFGLEVGIGFYPASEEEWNKVNKELYVKLKELLQQYIEGKWCHFCDIEIGYHMDIVYKYDAYYGSPSLLVHLFSGEKKPVMIANYEIKEQMYD